MSSTAARAITLGMNTSVCSWICVTAWKTETARPMTRPTPSMGSATLKASVSAVVARLTEHEVAQRLLTALDRLRGVDLVRGQRVDGVLLDLVEGGRHDEDRQEERDADQHLVRRRGGRAEAGADEPEDDEDPREAGDREQER